MTEFRDQNLSETRFEEVNLDKSVFSRVSLKDARLRNINLSGAEFRAVLIEHSVWSGVELKDVRISGELINVVVNGVDIGPLVDAELNRRMPERAKMRPESSEGFREAWEILLRLWAGTLERAKALPEELLHQSVDGEWSFIQTLRHLNFASAAWINRMALGEISPWHPLDLPWDEAPGWEGIPWNREARPSLEQVMAVRTERQGRVGAFIKSLTEEQLGSAVTRTEPGWPRLEGFPLKECLNTVLNEEWEHRLYAERDLAVLETLQKRGNSSWTSF
ncbi:DinB family protein [Psychromicrobium sp. YIM B11713]|uniref:DinB family protein n=1 Tax=Psychromicrobium sp. YIM B11713 TaxID=3145233 RepID=UPI00374F2C50